MAIPLHRATTFIHISRARISLAFSISLTPCPCISGMAIRWYVKSRDQFHTVNINRINKRNTKLSVNFKFAVSVGYLISQDWNRCDQGWSLGKFIGKWIDLGSIRREASLIYPLSLSLSPSRVNLPNGQRGHLIYTLRWRKFASGSITLQKIHSRYTCLSIRATLLKLWRYAPRRTQFRRREFYTLDTPRERMTRNTISQC